MSRKPQEIIEALGLTSEVSIEELSTRHRAYDSVHLGLQNLEIGEFLDFLKEESTLKPPRTGHIGNWEEIAAGRSGALDFNQPICNEGYGYPLIDCFTQTEAEEAGEKTGDWVYLPGSIIENGKREVLSLFTWDGATFTQRSREQALFIPFVQTRVDGKFVSLSQLHNDRMKKIPGFQFVLEPSVVMKNIDLVRSILTNLLEDASKRPNQKRAFQDLISHAVKLDGTMNRCMVRQDDQGYWLDQCLYSDVESLAEQVLSPFKAVTNSDAFFAEIKKLPPLIPVMSDLLIGLFTAIFTTHYPESKEDRSSLTQPFNVHLQWGGRDMAGFPPLRNGYFTERSTTRSLRSICTAIIDKFPEINPVCFLLLPAPIFMLCPSSEHPKDAELLSSLFKEIEEATAKTEEPQGKAFLKHVDYLARKWFSQNKTEVSPYFLNRFYPRKGLFELSEAPAQGHAVQPEGFRAITFQQACIVVGAWIKEMALSSQSRKSIISIK